jgi:hypothetical protein
MANQEAWVRAQRHIRQVTERPYEEQTIELNEKISCCSNGKFRKIS